MRTSSRRLLSLLLTTLLILSALTGCAKPDPAPSAPTDAAAVQPTADPALFDGATPIPAPAQPAFAEGGDVTVAMPEVSPEPVVDELAALTDTQRNSINMLNHLTVLTTKMNTARNNRLYLEETYSQVLNNFNPEMVDEGTQDELGFLLDELENYRMIAVKRERLQFLLEREQAQAFRSAMPDPLSLLSAVQSFSPPKLLASVAYMALDSVMNYASAMDAAELAFLQSNWELEDEEKAKLHEARTGAFNYMIQTVREYELPGLLSLNEKSINDFVTATANTNILQTIQKLESEVETYKAYGGYWLALAECYYTNGNYDKCLAAIDAYEALNIQIFRKDYELARLMPAAIVSAGEVLSGEEYVAKALHYADTLCRNTDSNEWILRYFAAQTYMMLTGITADRSYLETAYQIILNNVNELVNEQKALNKTFVAELVEKTVPADATDAQKDEIKAYNKAMKKLRKTELAPISEPLYLNCEMLFALANELEKDQTAKELINGILHENGEPIFLVQPVDSLFYYSDNEPIANEAIEMIDFDVTTLVLPMSLISASGNITVTVANGEEIQVIEDWKLHSTKRSKKEDFSSFTATYTSETAKDFKCEVGTVITVEINAKAGCPAETITLTYQGVPDKTLGVFNSVSIEKVQE